MEASLTDEKDGQNDLLIVSTLDLLHGVLLMHPPSRSLFAREIYMNVRLFRPRIGVYRTDLTVVAFARSARSHLVSCNS